MNRGTTVLILLLAAILEAGGDTVVRMALHRPSGAARVLTFVLGAALLFGYGYTVNAPAWDFGRLLGLYVVFFFVIAQALSWLVFKQTPSLAVICGGALIVSGGIVIAWFQ
jgi:drug/metabolite transporter superfamily protein YnfA